MLADKLRAVMSRVLQTPTYVDAVTQTGRTSGSVDLDLSALTAADGDLVFVYAVSDGVTGTLPACSAATALYSSTTSHTHYLGYFFVAGSLPGSVTITDVGVNWTVAAVSFQDTSAVGNTASASGSSGLPNAPAVTATDAKSVIVAFGALYNLNKRLTPPSGFTEVVDAGYLYDPGFYDASSAYVAYKEAGTAGSVDPAAWTGTGSNLWRAFTVELTPG